MKNYLYSRITGEFTHERDAEEDLLNKGVFFSPAYSARKKPPFAGANEVACYHTSTGVVPSNPKFGRWRVLPDHRGHYFNYDREPVVVSEIGFVPPIDWTNEPREITPEETQAENKILAYNAQQEAIKFLEQEELNVKYGLPSILDKDDKQDKKQYIISIQADVENPPVDGKYKPEKIPGKKLL